jgi:transposase InsO family protein
VAKFRDYVWHTDLHSITWTLADGHEKAMVYVIAFIDDASRYLIHHELLSEKTSESAGQALERALQHNPHPCIMASDNGGEFLGRGFKSVLDRYHIEPWHTKPYTPQQNGKMERFWRNIQDGRHGRCDQGQIQRIIDEYNNHWKHRALGCTPAEARQRLLYWQDCEIDPIIWNNLLWGTNTPELMDDVGTDPPARA